MPRNVSRPNVIERRMSRFLREPPSVKSAVQVIVVSTAVVVVGGGIAVRLLDSGEYPNVWVGMWLALQTVATVGYGDVAPAHPSGRLVAVLLMLYGVAFLTVIIAAITSTFIERSRSDRASPEMDDEGRAEAGIEAPLAVIEARLAEIVERLNWIDSTLRKPEGR